MSFFDSKEEVINIELTQYGKRLLSKGKFKPAYYAFFDDDIVYDSQYMGVTESQNKTQERILSETAFLKPVYNFGSLEKASKEYVDEPLNEPLKELANLERQVAPDQQTNYSLLLPLGNSSKVSKYYPSWQLKVLDGEISSCTEYINNTGSDEFSKQPFLKIPQIDMKTIKMDAKVYDEKEAGTAQFNELETVSVIEKDSKLFYIKRGEAFNIFEAIENNVDDQKENFEIEIFVEETQVINNIQKTFWRKLKFPKKQAAIKNGILLDEPLYQNASSVPFDNQYAQYYLNILIDDEIELPPEQRLAVNAYSTTITENDKPFGEDC
jgi:hypothetical protein